MTTRKFNFGAGPATIPLEVLEEVKEELLDWKGLGISVMEISHRSKEFTEIAKEAESDFRDLLSISNDYGVLFLHGGATLQMPMIPMNFTPHGGKADYVNTGHWALRAINEAKKYINVKIVASSEEDNFRFFPPQNTWKISHDSSYLHITPNETIGGIYLKNISEEKIPIIADYSSGILSEEIDVDKFTLIYGGAQKNIGPAGLGFAIVKKESLNQAREITPTMFNYTEMLKEESMYNTPPTFAWYMAGKTFKWLKSLGGIKEVGKINHLKAKKLYSFLDDSNFYFNNIDLSSRSIMNIPFLLKNPDLNEQFLIDSENAGLLALKGHRSVGGMRASIYNAMPEEGVDKLIEFMESFEKKNHNKLNV